MFLGLVCFWVFSSAGERFLHTEEVIGPTPITPTNLLAVLAQLAEQLPCKHQVVGSNPIDGTISRIPSQQLVRIQISTT